MIDQMLRAIAPLVVLGLLAAGAHADKSDLTADVIAVSDEAVLVDLHLQKSGAVQRGWVILSRTAPYIRTLWRERPKTAGPTDCPQSAREFAKVLDELHLDGVQLDARQCGKRDATWWVASQPLIADPTRDRPPNVTGVRAERLRATRDSTAFGPFVGTRFSARFTGKAVNLTRDGQSFAHLPTGLQPTVATGWVVVAPSSAFIVAFDADDGRFQSWAHDRGRWGAIALVDPFEPAPVQ
jgi:hypothetical protein